MVVFVMVMRRKVVVLLRNFSCLDGGRGKRQWYIGCRRVGGCYLVHGNVRFLFYFRYAFTTSINS